MQSAYNEISTNSIWVCVIFYVILVSINCSRILKSSYGVSSDLPRHDLSLKEGAVRDLILIRLGKYTTMNQCIHRIPVRGY